MSNIIHEKFEELVNILESEEVLDEGISSFKKAMKVLIKKKEHIEKLGTNPAPLKFKADAKGELHNYRREYINGKLASLDKKMKKLHKQHGIDFERGTAAKIGMNASRHTIDKEQYIKSGKKSGKVWKSLSKDN